MKTLSPNTITVAKKLNYKRTVNSKRVRVARRTDNAETRAYYGHTHTLEQITTFYAGEFMVTIDTDAIVQQLVGQCAMNSSGKSGAMSGLVKCKRLKEIATGTEVKTFPISEGYSIVEANEAK